MPFLDASALETDPEGPAFLLAVLRWRPDPRRSQAWGRLSPLLGPHTIRFDRGLAAAGPMRRSRRERVGFHLMRQGYAPPLPTASLPDHGESGGARLNRQLRQA